MKIRNIAIGIAVVGAMIAGGVAAVAWQKGWLIRETVELGAGVIAARTSRSSKAAGCLGYNMFHGRHVGKEEG